MLKSRAAKIILLLSMMALALSAAGCGGGKSKSKGTDPHAAADPHATADPHGGGGATASLPPGVNAVQNEMRLMNEAWQIILTSVSNNNLAAIPEAIHKVHTARNITVEAINNGEYTLPKNPDKMDEFIQMDNAFHDDLVRLLQAVDANDLQAATKQTGVLLNGCTNCHTKFRFK